MKTYQHSEVKIILHTMEDTIRTSQPTAVTNDYFDDSDWWESETGGESA